jgi:hypothetical protein
MTESRTHSLAEAGLTLAAGLLLALAVSAGSTAAAVDNAEASPEYAMRGRIFIACNGSIRSMHPPVNPHGDCTVSGAIDDSGKFVDSAHHRIRPRVRVLSLAKGSISISVYREHRGHWRILSGSRAYAGLRGRGWESTTPQRCRGISCPVSIQMTGRVSQAPASGGR